MIAQIAHGDHTFSCDLSKAIDLSISAGQVRCFYAEPFESKPFQSGSFVGSVRKGAPVNFYSVSLNPHGHGTHTEGPGHITSKQESVQETLKSFYFIAQVISIRPQLMPNGDHILKKSDFQEKFLHPATEALIIRTLPNDSGKQSLDYSGTNPAYIEQEAMKFIVDQKVKHLLIDLPSVDKESDGGKLLAHREFWKVKKDMLDENSRPKCTITELIFVPDTVPDGLYLLNLQTPNIQLDAVPSRPVIHRLTKLSDK